MSVRSDLVKETLVDHICGEVAARLADDLPTAVAHALDAGLTDEAESDSRALSGTVARAGYFARRVETRLFEAARAPLPALADGVRARVEDGSAWPDAVAEVARGLAVREPLERAAPDDPDAISWRVPGPGGHVRHYVALRLIAHCRPPSAFRPADATARPVLKRDFMYGFLVRCCEEATSDDVELQREA